MKSISTCSNKNKGDSVAFDQKSLFSDAMSSDISTCLTQFDHSAYAMIPGKLYKYEDSVDSIDLYDKPCADLYVPYNIALMYLKNTIIDIIFGKKKIDKKQFQKVFKILKVWTYQKNKQKWVQLTTESDWTHAKLLAQEGSDSLKLMYSLKYGSTSLSTASTSISAAASSSTATSPVACSTQISKDFSISNQQDDNVSVASLPTRYSSSRLMRLDVNTPTPPVVDITHGGSMLMLKNDGTDIQGSTYFESIPKEQSMANILESRLMKSRY